MSGHVSRLAPRGGAVQYLDLDDAALLAQCAVDTYRASGPGGQKRNKTDSAVRLRHGPTGLSSIGTESRSQHENKARALRRLRKTLALALRSVIDSETFQVGQATASCITASGRLTVGQRDHRYLYVVSEVLDLLAERGMQVSTAAAGLGVSTANLVSFLKKDPEVWDAVNRLRASAGLKPLR
jgi:hypothetical protein